MLFAETAVDGLFNLALASIAGLTAVVGAMGFLIAALARLRKQVAEFMRESRRRDDATDKDVESVATSLLRRGKVEAEKKGLIQEKCVDSPESPNPGGTAMAAVILPEVVKAYRPILPTLRQIRDANPGVTRARFALLVEQELGDWLVTHICRIYNVHEHACWEMAAQLAFDDDEAATASLQTAAG